MGRTSHFNWRHGNDIPSVSELMIQCSISWRGKLVGHFSVCGWLCVGASFVKSWTVLIMSGWDNEVTDAPFKNIIGYITRICQNEPAHSKFSHHRGSIEG